MIAAYSDKEKSMLYTDLQHFTFSLQQSQLIYADCVNGRKVPVGQGAYVI